MKKLLGLLLILLAVTLVFTACGNNNETPAPEPEEACEAYPEEETEEPEEVEEQEEEEEETPAVVVATGLETPEFTDTRGGIGFVLPETWSISPDSADGALFIIGTDDDSAIIMNVIGPHNAAGVSLADKEHVLTVMLGQTFGAEELEVETLTVGAYGYALLRAEYVIVSDSGDQPGMGFIVSNGQQLVFIQAAITGDSIVPAYLDFVSSIRFVD